MSFSLILKPLFVLLISFFLSACVSNPDTQSERDSKITMSTGANQLINLSKITNYQNLHDKNIFMQREDFSCGAASIATLMTYYFDDYTSESDVLEKVKTLLSEDEFVVVEEQGLSMLELETVANHYGYESASVLLTLDSLYELKAPIIVFIELDDYQHFAVLKAVDDGFAYLADPSRGNIELSINAFAESWSGKAFFMGKASFTPALKHGLSIGAGRPGLMVDSVVESELYKAAPKTFSVQPSVRVAQ